MIRAVYSDGNSAVPLSVNVYVKGTMLSIQDEQGKIVSQWPLDEVVRPRITPREGDPLVLGLKEDSGRGLQRLTVKEKNSIGQILPELAPYWQQAKSKSKRRWVMALAGIWLTAMLVWLSLPLLGKALVTFVPLAWEESLGEQTKNQVALLLGKRSSNSWIELSAEGQNILDHLVARLENTEVKGIDVTAMEPLEVFILDSGIVNAFALPGNSIVVTTALLKEIESLEELAGILAHERAHVRLRHVTQGLIRSVAFQVLVDFVSGHGSQLGSQAASYIITSGWTRDMEREADAVGLETLRQAKISPQGFQNFFLRLEESSGSFPLESILSTHPQSKDRAALIDAMEAYDVEPLYGEAHWRSALVRGTGSRSGTTSPAVPTSKGGKN